MYTVLVAVDADEHTTRIAAEAVAEFPGAEELEVVLLNVQKEFEATGEGGTVSSEEFYDETAFPESVALAEEILGSAGLSPTKRREHGDPAETIVDVARDLPADHIVLGNRKRSPAGKALFGSVTQSVLLDSDLPVTVVSRD